MKVALIIYWLSTLPCLFNGIVLSHLSDRSLIFQAIVVLIYLQENNERIKLLWKLPWSSIDFQGCHVFSMALFSHLGNAIIDFSSNLVDPIDHRLLIVHRISAVDLLFFLKFWLDFFLFAFRARANWSWTWCAGGRRCASSACWNSTASFRSITSSSHAPSTRTRGASPIWWVPPFSLLFFFYLLLFLRLAASDVDGEYTDSFWNYFSLSQKGPDAFGPFFFQPTEKKLCSLNSTNTRFSNLIGVYFIRL